MFKRRRANCGSAQLVALLVEILLADLFEWSEDFHDRHRSDLRDRSRMG
jgi:hypothetical protein